MGNISREEERLCLALVESETLEVARPHLSFFPSKSDYSLETYFSEDHVFIMPKFEEMSNWMFFLERLAVVTFENYD